MSQPNDTLALARRLETNEIAAWRAMYQGLSAEITAQLGIGCAAQGGALLIWNRSAPVPLLNRLLGLGVFEPAGDALIDALLERGRAERSRTVIQVTPGAEPADLAARLEARGLRRERPWLMHHRTFDGALPDPIAPRGYRIERVAADGAAAWGDALLAAWDFPGEAAAGALALVLHLHRYPGFTCFAAIHELSGQAVAAGALFVADGVAGLYADGVRAEHREHGLHDALIAARLHEARQLGCQIVCTQTLAEHAAQHNMALAGFTIAYERQNYATPQAVKS